MRDAGAASRALAAALAAALAPPSISSPISSTLTTAALAAALAAWPRPPERSFQRLQSDAPVQRAMATPSGGHTASAP